MVNRIFTGPFIALEERLIQEIAGLQSEDPLAPVAILVGSNVLATYLKYRIAERVQSAANLRFYTFLDLAALLASASPHQAGRPRLPRLGASVILDEILRNESPKVFEGVSSFDGFRRAILDTFRDLRDAGISPEELSRSIREIVRSRPDRREHLDAVARLYEAFRQKVASFRDVDDDFRAAIQNSARAAGVLGSNHLLIYGIYDATGQQRDLLQGLKGALNLVYLIPYVNSSASGFAAAFIDGLIRELEIQVTHLPGPPSSQALEIFPEAGAAPSSQQEPRRQDPRGAFSLILVPGESRVAIEIAREILRAVRDGIIAGFHEAAILLRHPEDEAPILAEAFRLRKIPFFIQGGVPFAQRPLSKAVMAIARLEADSFSRPSILRAMELIAAALPRDLAGKWDAPRWRGLTNDPAFLSGVKSWDRGTEDLLSRKVRELSDAERRAELPTGLLEEELEGHARSPGKVRQELEAARLLRNCWIALRQAAAQWPQQLTWGSWAQLLEERLAPILGASLDWQTFSAVLDNLSVLSDAAEAANLGQEIGREELTTHLEESLADFTFREGRFQRNGVNILSITASRGLHFPLVIVPGLDEGKFPARLRQDPFLLDEERRQIGNPSRLPLKSLRTEEEKLLFDMAARAAERRLILVASRLDENSDRERIPSDFFLRAAAAAKGRVVRYDELKEDTVPGLRTVQLDSPAPPSGEVAVDAAEIRLRLIATRPHGVTVLDALAVADPDRLARPRQFHLSRWKRILTRYDGAIRVPELVRWVAARTGPSAGQVSASRLEEYGKCPYLFFLKRVVGLEEWEEVEAAEGIHPLERGKLVHKILESFLKQYCGEKFTATPPAELSRSLSLLARDHLNEGKPPGIPDLLWDIESDRLLEMLQSWLEYEIKRLDGGFLPSHFEHAFGDLSPQEKAAPFQVQAGEYAFEFRGKIDRVDLSGDRKQARVLDYKVGSLPETMGRESATPLMAGEKLQLAVYSGALSALPEFSMVEQVQGEYLYLQPKDGRTVSRSFDPEILRAARMRLAGVLEIMGRGIENGAFFARTHGSVRTEDHCRFCSYLTICGKDRVQREERKAEDPAVQAFRGMKTLDEPTG